MRFFMIFCEVITTSYELSTCKLVQREMTNIERHMKQCLWLNPLTPNDTYSGRTAPLTSKRCILYIYSTNTDTEYFKHGVYSPFFFLFKMQFIS